MADEKILNEEVLDDTDFEEELLDDEELEDVAGGTFNETVEDGKRLRELGKFNWKGTFKGNRLARNLRNLGKDLGLNITYTYKKTANTHNEYHIDGKEVSQDEFWSIIKLTLDAQKK